MNVVEILYLGLLLSQVTDHNKYSTIYKKLKFSIRIVILLNLKFHLVLKLTMNDEKFQNMTLFQINLKKTLLHLLEKKN